MCIQPGSAISPAIGEYDIKTDRDKSREPRFYFPLGKLVGLGRIELPTYGLGNRRSVQLSYSPASNIEQQLNGGNKIRAVPYILPLFVANGNITSEKEYARDKNYYGADREKRRERRHRGRESERILYHPHDDRSGRPEREREEKHHPHRRSAVARFDHVENGGELVGIIYAAEKPEKSHGPADRRERIRFRHP